MRPQRFNAETIWCVHSPRSGEYWFVRCPSRSGAKIFLCGSLGPQVPTSKGPFETWEIAEEDVPEGKLLQAQFFPANDPRNWKPTDPDELPAGVASAEEATEASGGNKG